MTKKIFDDFENNRDYTIERLNKISSAISLFTVSNEIKFLHFNHAADAMFGYEPGGIMDATADDPLKFLHPENEDQFYNEIIATMRDGKFFNYTCRILCSDGTYKWAKLTAELVRQSNGTLYYYGVFAETPPPSNTLLKGLHALIAAGEEADRMQLMDLIESHGGSCEVQQYGIEALERFETSELDTFQCIFVGTRMKDVNGMELIKDIHICGHQQAQTIPLILLIDEAFEEDNFEILQDYHEIGITELAKKPFDFEKLAEHLAKFIK